MKRIIISGGGTGGHIFPAISIADALRRSGSGCEILFVGALGKMEMERVPAAGYNIIGLPVAGLQRKLTLKNLTLPAKVAASLRKARAIIKEFKPDVVVGVGGYASAPMLWQASRMKIPCLIQEQNSYAGLTNKLLGKRVRKICVAYEGMDKFFPEDKILFTGNPLREGIKPPTAEMREEGYRYYNLNPSKKTLLIVGGSLGARTLNESVQRWMVGREGRECDFQVLWQSGKYYREGIATFLKDHPCPDVHNVTFIDRMDLAYAVADVIVSRAGAGTISELCVTGKATIFVPSPNVAEDHQRHNAMALVEKGAALMVADDEARDKLMGTAAELLSDSGAVRNMERAILELGRSDAADVIAAEVLKLAE
ncbi:MAG: undecaprenyldiphospho-muramoylpentapeptide beta-N-acetylglucosaminyltransferase [Bacteroidales bacterium]|nr:undecaprenyldiphospho-muramoylpentapeptide beta-N-acetylglucosaminyltransferase [Bacteroidales bacterium]